MKTKTINKLSKIYRVIRIPDIGRVHICPRGIKVNIGDFGWETYNATSKNLISLTGYNSDFSPAWYADFYVEEIEYVTEKPIIDYPLNSNIINPYTVVEDWIRKS
jgi:hypothetical protein